MRTPAKPKPPADRIMSAARRKKKSATDLINDLIDKQIKDQMDRAFKNIPEPPTANTLTNTIGKKHTLFDDFYGSGYQGMYNINTKTKITTTPEPDSRNVAPPLKIIDETVILPIENFTPSTHSLLLSMNERGSYEEKVTLKLVGKETVEWWEFVLLYGFGKLIKTEIALEKNKELITRPSTSVQLKNKQVFVLHFIPKSNGKMEKVLSKVENEDVYKLIGTKYVKEIIVLEIPYEEESKTIEYLENGLIYEKKIDTFEPNYTSFLNSLEEKLNGKILSEELRLDISKQIYGRLRRI